MTTPHCQILQNRVEIRSAGQVTCDAIKDPKPKLWKFVQSHAKSWKVVQSRGMSGNKQNFLMKWGSWCKGALRDLAPCIKDKKKQKPHHNMGAQLCKSTQARHTETRTTQPRPTTERVRENTRQEYKKQGKRTNK